MSVKSTEAVAWCEVPYKNCSFCVKKLCRSEQVFPAFLEAHRKDRASAMCTIAQLTSGFMRMLSTCHQLQFPGSSFLAVRLR